MNGQKLDFQRFLTLVNSLPTDKKDRFIEKVEATVAMGVRALVLANIEKKDKESFEKTVESDGDAKILEFGFEKIPQFEKHLDALLNKVYLVALQSVESL